VVGSWQWEAGSQTLGQETNLAGHLIPSGANEPGGRDASASFVHHNHLYIFGGADTEEDDPNFSNDFWSYDLNGVDGWTFIGGSQDKNQKGEYGVKNVTDRSEHNIPGARYYSSSFVDPTTARGFIFGGYGYDKNGDFGYLNDLCKSSSLYSYCTHTVLTLYSYQGRTT
jgi:hypothetical protein